MSNDEVPEPRGSTVMPDPPIPHAHAAFLDFREATKDLGALSDAAQIVALKYQLLQALERAAGFQERRCVPLMELCQLCHSLVAAIDRAARLDAVHDPRPASFDASRASA
jgi:hypothetical protein